MQKPIAMYCKNCNRTVGAVVNKQKLHPFLFALSVPLTFGLSLLWLLFRSSFDGHVCPLCNMPLESSDLKEHAMGSFKSVYVLAAKIFVVIVLLQWLSNAVQ